MKLQYMARSFTREKFTSILTAETTIRYVSEDDGSLSDDPAFTLEVDKKGLRIFGKCPEITTQNDLQDFARLISDMWREHLTLAPKITQNLSGH